MTNEAMSLAIAEFLEPTSLPSGSYCDLNDFCGPFPDWLTNEDGDFYLSPDECWIFVYRGAGGWEKFQRDMSADPAMTVMLLAKMKEPELWKETDTLWQLQPDLMQEPPDKNQNYVLVTGAHLGRVVAEGFAKEHRIYKED